MFSAGAGVPKFNGVLGFVIVLLFGAKEFPKPIVWADVAFGVPKVGTEFEFSPKEKGFDPNRFVAVVVVVCVLFILPNVTLEATGVEFPNVKVEFPPNAG